MSEMHESDAVMVRRIGSQFFATWKAEQEADWRKWFGVAPAWFGIAAMIVSPLVGGGVLYAQIQQTADKTAENSAAIKKMEAEDRQDGQRLARIEGKLDMLISEKRR